MILVRHGQSRFNAVFSVTRVDPGITDPGITDEGHGQASRAAAALHGDGPDGLLPRIGEPWKPPRSWPGGWVCR